MHDPMRAEERVVGYWLELRKEENEERGVARSGVNGPLRCGSSSERFYDHDQLNQLLALLIECYTHNLDDLVVLRSLVRL